MDKNRYRFAASPNNIRELFMDVFPSYQHDKYDEHEMLAMVWACALAGKSAMDMASVSNGLILEATVSAYRRDKEASKEDA